MAKGISVGVAADTREFSTAVSKGVVDPLEDAIQALDDVEKAGDDAGDKLERTFKDAQGEVSDFKKEQSELAREMQKQSRRGGDALGDNVRKGTDRAGEGLDDLKSEAAGTAREAAASFDGSAESIGDAFQEVAANAFAGFGPAGAAAGILAAAGLGIAFTSIQGGTEQTEALREKVGELATEFIETGGIGESSIEGVVDRLKSLATEVEEGAELPKLVDLFEKVGKTGGRNFEDIAAAYAGSTDKLEKLIDREREYLDELDEENRTILQNADESDTAFSERLANAEQAVVAQRAIVDELDKSAVSARAAADAEAAYLASGAEEMAAKAQAIGTIDTAYDEAAGAASDFIDKETGILNTEAYLASMDERKQALADYQSSLATVDLSPEAKSFIDSQGFEAASAFLAGYEKSTPQQKARLNAHWSEAAKENSGAYMDDLNTAFKTPVAPPEIRKPVVPAPDMSQLENAMAKKYRVDIVAGVVGRDGKRIV